MNVRRRTLLSGVLIGAGLQVAVLDVAILHGVLGWHHALEPGNPTGVWTRPVWLADLLWALVGAGLVAAGYAVLDLEGFRRHRDALTNGALVGVGSFFAVTDVLVQHWVLNVHRVHPDDALAADVALLALGALLVAYGVWREYRTEASSRRPTLPTV